MLYAILAYHVEDEVKSWSAEEDATVMTGLLGVHQRLKGRLGPTARLGDTKKARTLRGPGRGTVLDGPFAETKEQLLGLYMIDCADEDAAIAAARDLRSVNPSAVYEIRAIRRYIPGKPFEEMTGASDL
ncbi:YciI family protein [Bradyrhizobium tropiciagri]|uniref:YciI family protein n=1 Tax=Bradyrhizobium tropiciagri TaxID=312253 RepID=UPI001BA62793|nr:YciI family protein [Bradyrhizobium tropiciagri]MBR0872906.1 YciI family protein [Bradyrhizobium tropiciagri]